VVFAGRIVVEGAGPSSPATIPQEGVAINMRRRGSLIALVCLAGPIFARAQTPEPAKDRMATAALHDGMRKLWEDHITWMRLYIVSASAGLPEKTATLQRLLQNQTDIGDAIKPYYGDAAGTKLTALLTRHVLIAGEVIDAARRGDTATKNAAVRRWGANADEIAAFLNAANPRNWPLSDLKQMLHSHLELTTSEVVAHLQKGSAGDVAAYDRIHGEILAMADALSSGIVAQFPRRF
jgi:hypothetical protein